MELIRLFVQIALLRRGPQDVPASPLLLALTIAGYFLVNFVVSTVLPPFKGPWVAHLCCRCGVHVRLVRAADESRAAARTLSADHAPPCTAFRRCFLPCWSQPVWLTRRFEQDSVWQLPASLLSLALVIWIIAANSHIVKAALEWSMPPSVALVILQTLAGQSAGADPVSQSHPLTDERCTSTYSESAALSWAALPPSPGQPVIA